MNTKFSYMYRDASNYKQHQDVVFEGELSATDRTKLYDHCDENLYFIPSQVGLEDLQERMTGFPGGDDHVWHELDGIESTVEPATETQTASQFVKAFLKAKWDVVKASKELGLKI